MAPDQTRLPKISLFSRTTNRRNWRMGYGSVIWKSIQKYSMQLNGLLERCLEVSIHSLMSCVGKLINRRLQLRAKLWGLNAWTTKLNWCDCPQTYATVLNFILAMAMNMDVQRRLQGEMDLVLEANSSTFPTLEMKPSLPYLEAAIKETLRWHPPAPTGELFLSLN